MANHTALHSWELKNKLYPRPVGAWPTAKGLHRHVSTHTPPSVVLLWIHVLTGEAPTSLLQETLMLYKVIACSPGTWYWKGGTVTLISRVNITSPVLRLTSLALSRIDGLWGSMCEHWVQFEHVWGLPWCDTLWLGRNHRVQASKLTATYRTASPSQ